MTLENTVQKCSQTNDTKKEEEKKVNSGEKRNDEDKEKKEEEKENRKDEDTDVDGKKDADRKDEEEEDGEKKEENCPTVCLGIQDPVCGSDGTIYPNACLMRKRNCGLKKVERMDMEFCFARARRKLSCFSSLLVNL